MHDYLVYIAGRQRQTWALISASTMHEAMCKYAKAKRVPVAALKANQMA